VLNQKAPAQLVELPGPGRNQQDSITSAMKARNSFICVA
jgi:hypothetical protein